MISSCRDGRTGPSKPSAARQLLRLLDHIDPVNIPNAASSSAKAQAKDPVCGMDVNPATARFKTLHNEQGIFLLLRWLPGKVPGESREDSVIAPQADGIDAGVSRRSEPGHADNEQVGCKRSVGTRTRKRTRGPTSVRCAPRCGSSGRDPVQSVEWRSIPSRRRSPRPRPNTPARCIRRSCDQSPGVVRSAAWLWSRAR